MRRIIRPMALVAIATLLSIVGVAMLLPNVSLGPLKADSADAATGPSTIIYNLYATDGYVNMADGTPEYIYGFVGGRQGKPFTYLNSAGLPVTVLGGAPAPTGGPITAKEAQFQGNAQLPGPVIWATTNDVVEIRLKNLGVANPTAPNDPHSIHLHGLDVDAANDGVPETSVGAVPANGLDAGAGNVIVYMVAPTQAGTYMYHCHQEASIHVQMGMYGALVVYNPTDMAGSKYKGLGPGRAQGGNLWGWNYDKDYIMLMTEIDTRQHVSEQTAAVPAFNPADYQPQYWMINGLSFPNTVHAASPATGFTWTNWAKAYPNYDPLITGSVRAKQKVLVRVINLGFETQPMHMHGFHAKVLGGDQRAWTWNQPLGVNSAFGSGEEKNTILIGSGETLELLLDFGQQGNKSIYPPAVPGLITAFTGGTQTKFTAAGPVSNTDVAATVIPEPATGSPYIGGPVVTGLVGHPDPAGQYFPFHNHDDYKATNNGVYPGGMFTMIRTNP